MATTRRWLISIIALNAFLLYRATAPWPFVLVGSLMLWGSAWPLHRHLRHERGTLPFVPALAIVYFVAYGLPTFRADAIALDMRIPEQPVFAAALLALGGELALLITFYLFPLRRTRSMLTLRLDLPRRIPRLLVAACALTVLRVVLGAGVIGQAGGQLTVAVADLSLVCVGGLYLCWLRGLLSPPAKLLTALLISFLLFVELGSGALARPLFVAGMFFFVFVAERGRLPLTALAICLALLLPFMATKMAFRTVSWNGDALGPVAKSLLFMNMTLDAFRDGRQTLSTSADVTESRADHLSDFAWVVNKTPDTIPYWGGATYAGWFWILIPRFLYPDKPTRTFGQEYGHRYGFLGAGDTTTSWNFEQLVEMYANFGAPGVLIGMFLIGLLYRWLLLFIAPHTGEGNLLIGAKVFTGLLAIESDFLNVHGAVLQTALIFYAFLWVFFRRRRPDRARALPPRIPANVARAVQ